MDNTFSERKLREMGIEFETPVIAEEFSALIQEELEVRIGAMISEGLSSEELREFDSISDSREAQMWLEDHRPDYRQIVRNMIDLMEQEIMDNRDRIPGVKKTSDFLDDYLEEDLLDYEFLEDYFEKWSYVKI